MTGNLAKLYAYVMNKVHGKEILQPHDFADTWTRVRTDYGDLWERGETRTDSQRMGLEFEEEGGDGR